MKDNNLDIRENYDFTSGVRGKYAQRFATGTNLVALEPDVAKSFPDSAAVNAALRKLLAGAEPVKSNRS